MSNSIRRMRKYILMTSFLFLFMGIICFVLYSPKMELREVLLPNNENEKAPSEKEKIDPGLSSNDVKSSIEPEQREPVGSDVLSEKKKYIPDISSEYKAKPDSEGLWPGEKIIGSKDYPELETGLLFFNGCYVPPPYHFQQKGVCHFLNGHLIGRIFGGLIQNYKEASPEKRPAILEYLFRNSRDTYETLKDNGIVLLYSEGVILRMIECNPGVMMFPEMIKGGEILVSDLPVNEKRKLLKKIKLGEQTYNHGLTYRGKQIPRPVWDSFWKEFIENFESSPHEGFLEHLKRLVKENEPKQKKAKEAYLKQFREDQIANIQREWKIRLEVNQGLAREDWEESFLKDIKKRYGEDAESLYQEAFGKPWPTPTPRHDPLKREGYTYYGTNERGQPIWLKDPVPIEKQKGICLLDAAPFFYSPQSLNHFEKPYWPHGQWRENDWNIQFQSPKCTKHYQKEPAWEGRSNKYKVTLESLLNGTWKVMSWSTMAVPLTPKQKEKLKKNKIKNIPYYQSRVLVIVPQYSSLDSISCRQISELLWHKAVPQFLKDRGFSKVNVYQEIPPLGARADFERPVTYGAKLMPGSYPAAMRDCIPLKKKKFFNAVAKNRWSIGFVVLYPGIEEELAKKQVRALPVSKEDGEKAIMPELKPIFQNDYPLREEVHFFIRPDAPSWTQNVIDYFLSPDFAETIFYNGVITGMQDQMTRSKQRLAKMKTGEGKKVSVAGELWVRPWLKAMGEEYVRAKAVIQPQYRPFRESGGVGSLATDFVEIAIHDRPLSERDMESQHEKDAWKALWAQRKDKPGIPEMHILPGRAVAICVHPANKLTSLTIPQLKAIFSSEIRTWESFPKAFGENPPSDQSIKKYGFEMPTTTAKLFDAKVCRPIGRHKATFQRPDFSKETLSQLASQPTGIAFVDAAALPADPAKAGIKVLAIGPADKAVLPSGKAIAEQTYPLSSRLYMYVSPKASEEARDWVKFILSGGASEKNPYTDVPAAVEKAAAQADFISMTWAVQPWVEPAPVTQPGKGGKKAGKNPDGGKSPADSGPKNKTPGPTWTPGG